jgi:hypothetical protein
MRDVKKRLTSVRRAQRGERRVSGWSALFGLRRGEYLGPKRAWKCSFCGVIGSHRRGCHYVTQEHHHDPKAVRRGVLGVRARALEKKAMAG